MSLILDDIVLELQKQGTVQVQDILSPQDLREINSFFDEHRNEFVPALVGKGQDRKRVEAIRGDHTFWIDPLEAPSAFSRSMALLEQLRTDLNRALYLGLKEFECHLAYYPVGTYYKKHSDRFEKDSSRSLSFIFYLHEEWNEGEGGELVLYDQSGAVAREVKPLPGSFAAFLSEDFPHEVLACSRERRSLTGWMHTRIIN